MNNNNVELRKCDFCGKAHSASDAMYFSSQVDTRLVICSECIEKCHHAIDMTLQRTSSILNGMVNAPQSTQQTVETDLNFTPSQLKAHLDDYVINQNDAKQVLSVAVYNHFKRVNYNAQNIENEVMKLKKSNVLMVGKSGSGKTLFVETLAKKLGVPYTVVDATSLTEAGYVGDDVEVSLQKLIQAANGNVELAERGIIFIDEIDKIGRKGENVSLTRDVSGEGVQQALLKMLEGSVVRVPVSGNRKHPNQECYEINTSNILFICGGAFEGIEKIIEKRMVKKSEIGFNVSKEKAKKKDLTFNELILQITSDDLRKFGMMPEVLGRLPVICPLEELDTSALVKILTEPVDSITKQYQKLFEIDGIELHYTKDSLTAIADKAIAMGTGARALRTIMEKAMTPYMFSIPDNKDITKVTITKDCIVSNKAPKIECLKAI